jgi:hypothetical protein
MPLNLGVPEIAIPRRYADAEQLAKRFGVVFFPAVDTNLDGVVTCFWVVDHGFLLGVSGLLGRDFWCF